MDFNTEADESINEKAVIESLFTGCASQGNGKVKVSKLIEYLGVVAGDNVEFGGNFDDLAMLLDPKRNDTEVDIKTYCDAMYHWIEDIRCRNSREDVYYGDTSPGNQASPQDGWGSMNGSKNSESQCLNVTSDSVEGFGGESPLKQDWELITKIEDLQLNNKRLVDHNAELSFQMENTEENNNQLLNEVEILRKQLRNYQTLDEKNKTIEKENEELRQTVTDLQETSKSFQNKTKQLEKDRVILNEFQEELQTKLSAAHRRLESLSNDHRNVCLAYNEEKQRLIQLEELQGVKEEMDKESTGTQEYLTTIISELTMQKEALQVERNKMESELFQVREDLNRLMVRNASTLSSSERNSSQRPLEMFCPAGNSLQQELQEITQDDCLPSPIVGHSSSSNQNSSYESDVFDSLTNSINSTVASPLSLVSLNSSTNSPFSKSNEYFSAVSQVAADFRLKKEKALQTISELVCLEKTRENREIRERLQRELEKEMEFFAEKIWLLSLARKASEKRVSKLLTLIEKLKDENHELQDERDRALQKIGNLSLGNEDMETKMEELASDLQASMENAKQLEKRCSELQTKLKDAESEVECIRLEKENALSSLKGADSELTNKYCELERKYQELEERHEIALAKVLQMERQLERTSLDLSVEKKRSISLQESLSLSVSKHEQELQEIMETIPDRSFNGSPSQSKSSAITGYQVRTKLRAFLTNKYLAVRDSPDGKPTNHEDEVPVGVSTPIEGHSIESNDLSKLSDQNPQSTTKTRPSETPYPINKVIHSEEVSPDSIDSSGVKYDDSSALSSISPNLIRPYDTVDDQWISPSLIEHFDENGIQNETFSKPGHSTELQEWQDIHKTPESFNDGELLGGPHLSKTEDRNSTNASENCAKNLMTDFSAEATTGARSISTNQSNVFPEENDRNSPPISPTIPSRFRKISNITPPRIRRKGVTGTPPDVVSTTDKASNSPIDQNPIPETGKATEKKEVFTFDGLVAERSPLERDSTRASSRLTNSSVGDDKDNYDSDHKNSPRVLNSYIEGVSLNSSLPSNEDDLEKLFKSVCLAFRTDKDSLTQRLKYQERACDAAENDIIKTLNIISYGFKSLEQNITGESLTEDIKDTFNSLHNQIGLLNECSRRVSSLSHQYGGYHQEARMMSGIDVLIQYGESLSRRLETLAETISAKKVQEQINRTKECSEDTQTKGELSNLSRRGSSFYNFVSSMRANDSFRLFGSGTAPAVTTTADQAELNTEITSDCGESDNKDVPIILPKMKNLPKQRSCLGRCFSYFIKLLAFLMILVLCLYILIQYTVLDKYFIVNELRHFIKTRGFTMVYYDHEPAV